MDEDDRVRPQRPRGPDLSGLPDWLVWLGAPVAVFFGFAVVLAALALIGRFVLAAMGAGDDADTALRDLFLILAGVLGAPFVIWRTWVAQRQADTGERQAETALQANLTARLNEAVKMLGATVTAKVRRRPLFYRYKVNSEADWTMRHLWDYEGVPVDLPDWMEVEHGDRWLPLPEWRALTPEDRRKTLGEFKDAEEQRPNIEVRLGALYALERISQDSARDHVTVMETICAYITQNGSCRDLPPLLPRFPNYNLSKTVRHFKIQENSLEFLFKFESELKEIHRRVESPRKDIEVAFHIIGRRSAFRRDRERLEAKSKFMKFNRIDFRGFEISNLDISDMEFQRSYFDGVEFRNASLETNAFFNCHFDGSRFAGVKMKSTSFFNCELRNSDLRGVNFVQNNFFNCNLDGSTMSGCTLSGKMIISQNFCNVNLNFSDLSYSTFSMSDFSGPYLCASFAFSSLSNCNLTETDMRGADLEGTELTSIKANNTNFSHASMNQAFLTETNYKNCILHAVTLIGAGLWKVDLSETIGLTAEAICCGFGDGSVHLPAHIDRPTHWPPVPLSERAFRARWAGWRLSRGEPWPPPGRALARFANLTPTPPDTPVAPEEIAHSP